MQVIGKLEEVHETVKRSETFQVREFVLEIQSPNSQYAEHVLFQLTNNRTALIDQFQIGQELTVDFDLSGRKWTNPEGKVVFFNRLNVWRIMPYSPQAAMGYQQPQQPMYQQPQQPMYQAQQPQGFAPQQPQPMAGYNPQGFAPQPAPPAPAAAPAAPAVDGGDANDLPF